MAHGTLGETDVDEWLEIRDQFALPPEELHVVAEEQPVGPSRGESHADGWRMHGFISLV
jgi:hypothetical protein